MRKLIFTALTMIVGLTQIYAQQETTYDVTPGNGNGLRFWSSNQYKIHMGNSSQYNYGPVNTFSIKMNMSSDAGRGWTWGSYGLVPIAALSNTGEMQIASSFTSNGKGRFGSNGVYIDWTNETNWGGLANKWTGYIGFNAYRNNEDPKDYYYGKNKYTHKAVIEGSNYGFRFLYRKTSSNDSDGQHQLGELLRITEDCNVGIGVTDPIYKLSVDGTISATEVKVSTTPNSDYVFEPDYDLKPIEEVEAFIKENKHLPDIPSAEEFKENGVGLSEMDDMLLRKVEELTLYVIEQSKKLKAQSLKLKAESSRNEDLMEVVMEVKNENEALKARDKEIDELKTMVEALMNEK